MIKNKKVIGMSFVSTVKELTTKAIDNYNKYVEDEANILASYQREIESLNGSLDQNAQTGGRHLSSVQNYTNRLFGAPYQLLESVDRRYDGINKHVGSEYLKHFLLHSPILYIKPGMPRYTGDEDAGGMFQSIADIYKAKESGHITLPAAGLLELSKYTLFKVGSQLQQRMFGFRPTYMEYMSYVNYMCRSVAMLMGLTAIEGVSGVSTGLPNGTFTTSPDADGELKFEAFETLRWENYRMSADQYVPRIHEQFGQVVTVPLSHLANFASGVVDTLNSGVNFIKSFGRKNKDTNDFMEEYQQVWAEQTEDDPSWYELGTNKINTVMFNVDPISFTEGLANNAESSQIESSIDAISGGIGSEIAFMTNSRADHNILGKLAGFIGGAVESASLKLSELASNATGGFLHNLFSGAIHSIKGQKMIYPKIYKSSESNMDYQFSVTLSSPYGDAYNYYMNVVVPLMHLIGLAAPRMMTSNTTASPFLVQAYIPGMCTCQLGIINQMEIVKNHTMKHVSVNGFPLTIKVSFTVKELYNAMAISPAHDPASFLFNETLNDYLANLAGLIPSTDTYYRQKAIGLVNMDTYFKKEMWDDIFAKGQQGFENWFPPANR